MRLDCTWQQDGGPRIEVRAKKAHIRQQQQGHYEQTAPTIETKTGTSPLPTTVPPEQGQEDLTGDDVSFNRIFNYASFMWDEYSPNMSPSWDTLDLSSSQELIPWSDTSLTVPMSLNFPYISPILNAATLVETPQVLPMDDSPRLSFGWSESQLAEYFARSAAPPILATVETSAHWIWMRKELTSMTSTSRMVKSGVMAFVAMELESGGSLEPASHSKYYQTAKERLEDCLRGIAQDRKISMLQLRHILAVLFLLSYIDLLTKDVAKAHANLREGFDALQMVNIDSLGVTGKLIQTPPSLF